MRQILKNKRYLGEYVVKFNALIPELSVSDFERSLAFYIEILGFHIEYQRPEERFAFLGYEEVQLMIEQEHGSWQTAPLEQPYGRGSNFQMEISSLEPLLTSLGKHNYKLFREPEDSWYRQDQVLLGQREFLVQDPYGYLLRFSQFLEEKPVTD